MGKKKVDAVSRAKKNREQFVSNVLNLFRRFTPAGTVELRDFIKDGERSGEHTGTSWSNEHLIKIATCNFDAHPREAQEVLDTICHEAHHAAMHDINCMLLAGGRLSKDEVELIMERSAWAAGYMVSAVVKNIDWIKRDYEKCEVRQ